MADRSVERGGRTYIWTGRDWYEKATKTKPDRWIVQNLETSLSVQPLSVDEKLNLAREARVNAHMWIAEELLRETLRDHAHDHVVVAQISGVLREWRRPDEVLRITAPFVGGSYAPIFTTRAAALCDLGRWEEASHEVRCAMAACAEGEAYALAWRIKKRRRDEAMSLVLLTTLG